MTMSINKSNSFKYIVYVRKSEEREEKQVLSLQAQKDKIQEQFPDLNIIDIVEESRSAFKPYNRPLFEKRVIERIKRGEADGIIAWHPNRLSRNEIDAATITYMARKGVIKELRFCAYTFENNPEGIMMLQIIMSQSQYESSKQARDVKRGMKQKASGGERPGVVVLGYDKVPVLDSHGRPQLRPKDNKIITETGKDPVRFELVKKMWQMMLSGTYTAQQIRQIANDEWGFTTREVKKKNSKRIGDRPLGSSQMYRIFNSPFYAGWIVHEGEWYEGNHEKMITLDQYDYVQMLLKKNGKPRVNTYEYAFTGLIVCGDCGCSIVGKHNAKFVKREKKIVHYIHYHCTKRSDLRPCSQTKYTTVEELEKEIDTELAKYTILPEFRDLALDILHRNHKVEVKDRQQVYVSQQKRRNDIQSQVDTLIEMRTKGSIDDAEYGRSRTKLKLELAKIDEHLRGTEVRADDWMELTEKAFDFATYARIHFKDGTARQKRDILMTLGQNLTLLDGKLTITPNEWLSPIAEGYPELEKSYLNARTKQKATSPDEDMALALVSDSWRASGDLNPGHPA